MKMTMERIRQKLIRDTAKKLVHRNTRRGPASPKYRYEGKSATAPMVVKAATEMVDSAIYIVIESRVHLSHLFD